VCDGANAENPVWGSWRGAVPFETLVFRYFDSGFGSPQKSALKSALENVLKAQYLPYEPREKLWTF